MGGVPSSGEMATECDYVPVIVTCFATYSFDSQELAVRNAFLHSLGVQSCTSSSYENLWVCSIGLFQDSVSHCLCLQLCPENLRFL